MSYTFSALDRNDRLMQMEKQEYDILIIGGGITGAGIALDAQTRGLKTALIEMQDFASGTSSRSTKLVHGGLRYLKQLQVKMVADVGKERAVVYENGPHVTKPEWMLLPFYKDGTFGALSTSLGLRLYDYLAGVKREERRKMLNVAVTAAKEPLLKTNGLLGGGTYVEYRTDDARLTMEVLKKAVSVGATAVNYTKADRLLYDNGKLVGAIAKDMTNNKEYRLRARQIVNATGPWVDQLRTKDHSKRGKTLRLTKGVHLVFDGGRFPLRQAVYFDTKDKRMIFAIPRDGKTYVGTTDTDYTGDTQQPRMTEEDRSYLLAACNDMFPDIHLTERDVESSWAGLRPLIYEEGKSPSEVSRRDEIFTSPSGMITIAGGKLTGYRKMAEQVTNLISKRLPAGTGRSWEPCITRTLPMSGGDVGGSQSFPAFVERMTAQGQSMGLTQPEARMLSERYGSNVTAVFDRLKKEESGLANGLPASLYAMLAYSMEEEMTVKPVDFFIRRTGALFFDIHWVHEHKAKVTDYMAARLGYTEEQKQRYTAELDEELRAAITPVKGEETYDAGGTDDFTGSPANERPGEAADQTL